MNYIYQFLVLASFVFILNEGLKTNTNSDYMRWETTKECNFKSYPLASDIEISNIKAPVAKLQDSVLVTVASMGGDVNTALSALHDLVDVQAQNAASKYAKRFAAVAPKLSAGMGVFGAVFGIISSQTTPDASDAVDAANRAIGKLTYEVNMRLDRMKHYVNKEIIKLVRDDLEKQFKEMTAHWNLCLKEKTKEATNDCMRRSFNKLQAKEAHFLQYSDKMNHNQKPTVDEVRKIEASLESFRDYAFFVVYELEILIQTFKSDNHYLPIYKKSLQLNIDKFAKYAKWAVEQVKDAHLYHGDIRHGYCAESFKCGAVDEKWEWTNPLWKSNTEKKLSCHCQMDQMSLELCTIHIAVWMGDYKSLVNNPGSWTRIAELEGKDKEDKVANMKDRAKKVLSLGKTYSYIPELKKMLDKYWDESILNRIKVWVALKPKMSGDEYAKLHEMTKNFKFTTYQDPGINQLLEMADCDFNFANNRDGPTVYDRLDREMKQDSPFISHQKESSLSRDSDMAVDMADMAKDSQLTDNYQENSNENLYRDSTDDDKFDREMRSDSRFQNRERSYRNGNRYLVKDLPFSFDDESIYDDRE